MACDSDLLGHVCFLLILDSNKSVVFLVDYSTVGSELISNLRDCGYHEILKATQHPFLQLSC